jgi:hypothetical protein
VGWGPYMVTLWYTAVFGCGELADGVTGCSVWRVCDVGGMNGRGDGRKGGCDMEVGT